MNKSGNIFKKVLRANQQRLAFLNNDVQRKQRHFFVLQWPYQSDICRSFDMPYHNLFTADQIQEITYTVENHNEKQHIEDLARIADDMNYLLNKALKSINTPRAETEENTKKL